MTMDHDRCSELLLPYVQESLDEGIARDMEEHLATCAGCRAERNGLEALLEPAAGELTDLERASLHRELRSRIPVSAGEGEGPARLAWLPSALGIAAALLVVVLGVQFLGGAGGGEEDSAGDGGASIGAADPSGPRPVTLRLTRSGVRAGDLLSGRFSQEAGDSGASAEGEMSPEQKPQAASPDDVLDRAGSESATITDSAAGTVEGRLKDFARTSKTFTRFARAYSAEDVAELSDPFIEELARSAPGGSSAQVTECAELVVSSREAPTLAAAAAHGIFREERSLMLGFVWTPEEAGPLDNYVLYVWPLGSCDAPTHSQSGRIRTGGR
jgi:hypothetical protein